LSQLERLSGWAPDFAIALLAAGIGVAAALLVHFAAFKVLTRIAQASESQTDDIVFAHIKRPSRYALVALGIVLASREVPDLSVVWQKLAGFVMPALVGWMALAILNAVIEAAALHTEAGQASGAADEVHARRRRTRLAIFGRIATFIVLTVTIGLMLFSIPGVREIGVTLMASAGLAGLAVGAAAQPTLKSLIAGLQMALTEPIRLGDHVTIDGESGRVEDIRSAYVIVRIWDDRRMIVPSSRFLDTSFITATRQGSASTGAVMLFVRPEADVAAIRAAFLELLSAHPKWDRRKGAVATTNSTIDTLELRLTLSAATPGDLFDLRSDMREAMLAWLRDHQPAMIGTS
jgi:small-conductance mechanosensitive channel